jgi:uncharacterized protein YbjT (DUF2867 family)
MILVAGSTGILGSEIVRQFREQDKAVRALVRKTTDPDKVARLKNMGAEVVEGDLSDKASLVLACRGVDTVITTVTSVASQIPGDSIPKVDQFGQLNLVEAASMSAVSHFIYISYSGNILTDSPLTTAKRTVEERLMASGMAYTILRPSYFIEAWLSPFIGFDYPNNQARIYGAGQNPISWISFMDVARFAVQSVDNPAARNAVLELGGPDPLSPNEVIAIFESLSGKPFRVEYVPVEALQGQKAAAVDPLQQSFIALMLDYANGDAIPMEKTLQAFPVALSSVQAYAQRVMVTAHEAKAKT